MTPREAMNRLRRDEEEKEGRIVVVPNHRGGYQAWYATLDLPPGWLGISTSTGACVSGLGLWPG
jgi:uncharacterized protein YbdZ (MbtH family)